MKDVDIRVLRAAVTALKRSTSRRMLKANMEFLVDYFLSHPSSQLPPHLQIARRGSQ